MSCVPVSGIPRKHARKLQQLHLLVFTFGTFAYAKDQASLARNGLRIKTRHLAYMNFVT